MNVRDKLGHREPSQRKSCMTSPTQELKQPSSAPTQARDLYPAPACLVIQVKNILLLGLVRFVPVRSLLFYLSCDFSSSSSQVCLGARNTSTAESASMRLRGLSMHPGLPKL